MLRVKFVLVIQELVKCMVTYCSVSSPWPIIGLL